MDGSITYRSAEGNTLWKTPDGWYFQPKDGKKTNFLISSKSFSLRGIFMSNSQTASEFP